MDHSRCESYVWFSALEPQGDLPARTRALVERYGVAESAVVFELSERHPFGQPAEVMPVINHYKRNNFRLAIDDFGTGFSGLRPSAGLRRDVAARAPGRQLRPEADRRPDPVS